MVVGNPLSRISTGTHAPLLLARGLPWLPRILLADVSSVSRR